MSHLPSDTYAHWRAYSPGWFCLADESSSAGPSEALLQQIWRHQRVRRERLCTLDGRPVVVLHPGFWNREAGPDFRGAVVQIGNDPATVMDIEVDLGTEGWHQHGHVGNPAYRGVGLHVVWQARSGTSPLLATLELRELLDAPVASLEAWLGTEAAAASLFVWEAGRCARPVRNLDAAAVQEVLRQAAKVRLERKAELFRIRARDAGWQQALWEGLLCALGYKHNAWPMRRLGELHPRILGDSGAGVAPVVLQARLLGLSGLLPSDLGRPLPDSRSRAYWRRLWDIWWRERGSFADLLLPRSVWRLHGLRPANHPHRRLALAAHWLADPRWLSRLEAWALRPWVRPHQLVAELLDCLQPAADEYWLHHWTLSSGAIRTAQPLLGAQRCTDLAMNVVLPWLWSRAGAVQNGALQQGLEARYFAWPASEDNAVLRRARQRLGREFRAWLPSQAAVQQGLLQVVRDFCDHSNAACEGCSFPDLLAGLAAGKAPAEPT